ncbi:hypothetical protein B5M42_002105 [Paenibacillus athensensis]|uniref:Uncharacterized protein n=1 Tax=Paenibacillus athensensis TaxID=1967502 RepID=A0A4Y8QAC5_9BACL|nr:hypothetical protein [Paenibacillus athensensis]MCD1257631.1 hypothetical protein [Paenibacillus athensensis]
MTIQRYRLTRALSEPASAAPVITLEECQQYFADKPDFVYSRVYTVTGSTTMSIEGDFFLWNHNGTQIPFRHYQGDLYVSGTNPAVLPVMRAAAEALGADVLEG